MKCYSVAGSCPCCQAWNGHRYQDPWSVCLCLSVPSLARDSVHTHTHSPSTRFAHLVIPWLLLGSSLGHLHLPFWTLASSQWNNCSGIFFPVVPVLPHPYPKCGISDCYLCNLGLAWHCWRGHLLALPSSASPEACSTPPATCRAGVFVTEPLGHLHAPGDPLLTLVWLSPAVRPLVPSSFSCPHLWPFPQAGTQGPTGPCSPNRKCTQT